MPDPVDSWKPLSEERVKDVLFRAAMPSGDEIDLLAREVLAGRRLREAAEKLLGPLDKDGESNGVSREGQYVDVGGAEVPEFMDALSAYPSPEKEAQ